MMTLPSSIVAAEPTAAFSIEHSQGFPVRAAPSQDTDAGQDAAGDHGAASALEKWRFVRQSVVCRVKPIHSDDGPAHLLSVHLVILRSTFRAAETADHREKTSI